jgi:hypothetical protein
VAGRDSKLMGEIAAFCRAQEARSVISRLR